jgi:hypothetical protein
MASRSSVHPVGPLAGLVARLAFAAAAWWLVYQALEPLAGFVTYTLIGLSRDSALGSSVAFFLYDVPKILLLLGLIVFAVGVVRSFFSPERTRALLGGKAEGVGNVLAAMLGIVTPFCSCSAVPLFIGFVESGVPLGVTFSFLIAAPMINEVAVVLLFGLFGWKVAGLYIATGLSVAILSGFVIGKLKMERYVEDFVWQVHRGPGGLPFEQLSWPQRLEMAWQGVKDIVGKVWLYVVAGIGVGSLIHGYVPAEALAGLMGKDAWWSVPLAVLIGVPLYSNAAGIIPIVSALLEKGAAVGTVLAFMMAVIGLSLPETIILRRVLKLPLILVFVGVVGVGIVITGYLFNIVL